MSKRPWYGDWVSLFGLAFAACCVLWWVLR